MEEGQEKAFQELVAGNFQNMKKHMNLPLRSLMNAKCNKLNKYIITHFIIKLEK